MTESHPSTTKLEQMFAAHRAPDRELQEADRALQRGVVCLAVATVWLFQFLTSRPVHADAWFIVVVALPLDGLSLIRKLSVDQKFRDELVSRAQQRVKDAPEGAEKEKAKTTEKEVQAQVDELMSLNLPQDRSRERYPGFLLSWILLSLGAPFWYDALKNALRFRSLVAQKEEQDRKDRQTAESTEGGRIAGAAASIAAGTISIAAVPVVDDDERGNMDDVVAVG